MLQLKYISKRSRQCLLVAGSSKLNPSPDITNTLAQLACFAGLSKLQLGGGSNIERPYAVFKRPIFYKGTQIIDKESYIAEDLQPKIIVRNDLMSAKRLKKKMQAAGALQEVANISPNPQTRRKRT